MLTLYLHPLAAFCWKPLVALYESGTDFTPHPIDLASPEDAALLEGLWPLRLFPVLRDGDVVLPESSVIIEYLDLHHPGARPMVPRDAGAALQVRLWDRFFDMHVQMVMTEIVRDRLRPDPRRDPLTVAEQKAKLDRAYAAAERHLDGREWLAGDFSMADCAAVPALFYAGIVHPFDGHPALSAYFERLMARPSARRVIHEAQPWMRFFPFRELVPARFLT